MQIFWWKLLIFENKSGNACVCQFFLVSLQPKNIKIMRQRSTTSHTGLDQALDDARMGRIHHADGVGDVFQQILGDNINNEGGRAL